MEPCPGCHAGFEPVDGPTHRYIGASPGCWSLYGEVLAGEVGVPSPLVVDAYAAQHPGTESPQATQSVAAHLVTLEAVLSLGSALDVVTLRRRAVAAGRQGRVDYVWMSPAPGEWPTTLVDVVAGVDPGVWAHHVLDAWKSGHGHLIELWARSVA